MWKVKYHSKKVRKQAENLPLNVADALGFLMDEIKVLGPVRGNWPNYGKLSKPRHHCHLKKGHPTYVAVWEEDGEQIELIRIIYAGTHENAPY